MNNVPVPTVFYFEKYEINVYINEDGNPWFRLSEICKVLGISKVATVIDRLEEKEYGQVTISNTQRNVYFINESGFYKAMLRSNKPIARRFENWLTQVVLPSIRKTGSYSISQNSTNQSNIIQNSSVVQTFQSNTTPEKKLDINMPDLKEVLELCLQLQIERLRLEAENSTMKPKAEFYDVVIDANDTFTIADTAKLIGIPGLGRNNLFNYLKSKCVLQQSTVPYQRFMNSGYFKTREVVTSVGIKPQTLVTNRGIEYIIKLLKCDNMFPTQQIHLSCTKELTNEQHNPPKLAIVSK